MAVDRKKACVEFSANYKKQFARRLRVALAARNKTGNWLSKTIGITSTSVYDYLNGNALPHADTLALICRALKVDGNELLGVNMK